MLFFDLGKLPGQQSMLIFHALAQMGIEALVLVSPKIPLVSIGYFQDAQQEVDLRYCKESKIPFMRREVGGGATYLDENQIFYQLIWKKDNQRFPRTIDEIYPWFSKAPIETYRTFGIEAEFRVVNDIITKGGRKIAGEGGGNIGDCMVFVGGILLDFDYQAMSRILKVPDEKFRDKVYRMIEENLTTMKRELGIAPRREEVVSVLKERFEKRVGKLDGASLTPEIIEKMKQLESRMTSEEFLLKKTPRIPNGVKIREGVEVLYGLHKAKGGLIRTAEEVSQEKIRDITISGDFTLYPKESLDRLAGSLKRVPLEEDEIIERLETFYEKEKVESPGVASKDIAQAILNPVKDSKGNQ
jgi:lipoate-protein ligase A